MRDRVWLEDHQGPLPHPAQDRAAVASAPWPFSFLFEFAALQGTKWL
jgi:hypothetical protein